MEPEYLAFLALAALLTITPGPDMAIVTRSALDGGWGAAVRTTLGINAGLLAWALAAALGVAAVVAASAEAFTALKLAGAAYLVWLGVQALRRAHAAVRAPIAPGPQRHAFRDGLLTNLLNPKIGVFYATVLPQFLVPGRSVVLQSVALALAHNVMGVLWLPAYARVVVWAGDVLRRPAVRRALERVTGVALIGLGAGVALERR